MGKELTIRQERFISEYLKTLAKTPYAKGNASRAYMNAGYKPTTRNALDVSACQLLNHPKIKARLRARKRAMLKRSDITIEKLLSDAEEARKLAIETKQVAAATGAGQFQAKLVGLLVDRRETGAPGDFHSLSSADEIVAAIRAEMGEEAANALLALVGKASAPPSPPPAQEPEEAATATVQGPRTIN